MIRFCDMEVNCIESCSLSDSDALNRADLLLYFMDDHQDEIVCVYDDFTSMVFQGIITYWTLNQSVTFRGAIRTQYLVLNSNIWWEAREYFKYSNKTCPIPVLDQNYQLICFAYEDLEANREIRMLRELTEKSDALQFSDVYPEYRCVRIHDFNELAYCFAKYLEKRGIPVEVNGVMWQDYFEGQTCIVPEYECYTVYAEGINGKKKHWKENLLRSVSAEFECVDKIYEENVRAGIIKDVDYGCETLRIKLKELGVVAILGTDMESQDACEQLQQMGVEVECFIADGNSIQKSRLLGKPVLNGWEAMNKYDKELVLINCYEKHSTLLGGGVDYFDYRGYERNKKYFCLKDYMQLQGNNLKSVLSSQKIVLVGDYYLCERLAEYLKCNCSGQRKICYLALSEAVVINGGLDTIDETELEPDMLCLIVAPKYIFAEERGISLKEQIMNVLNSHDILAYSDYFSNAEAFINLEKSIDNKYPHEDLRIKRIVLGSIQVCCGNFFFKGLLDGHPQIALLDYADYLSSNLFWICIRLAGRSGEEIISLFDLLYKTECTAGKLEDYKYEKYLESVGVLLNKGDRYTSQELFIVFHMAYLYMLAENDIKIQDIKNMMIYWEPHCFSRHSLEKCTKWLETEKVPCEIVEVVRNACVSRGSRIKGLLKLNWRSGNQDEYTSYNIALECAELPEDDDSKRWIIRFEDLKCEPEKELHKLCADWNIAWSDTLMSTTRLGEAFVYKNGEKDVTNFDLSPVYNTYEEYFSEFDRFRIALINSPYQKTYGYPYVDPLLFSRRDLQEMFLKDFRFGEKIKFNNMESWLAFHIRLQNTVRQSLWRARMISWRTSLEQDDN